MWNTADNFVNRKNYTIVTADGTGRQSQYVHRNFPWYV